MLVWLSTHYNEQYRNKKAGGKKYDSKVVRLLSGVKGASIQGNSSGECAYFRSQLVRHGLADDASAATLEPGMIVAIVRVRPVTQPLGVLSRLTTEQRLSWMLHRNQPMSWLMVDWVVALRTPMRGTHNSASCAPKTTWFSLTEDTVEGLLMAEGTSPDSSRVCTVLEHMVAHPETRSLRDAPRTVLQLWGPLAWLIARGAWSDASVPKKSRVSRQCQLDRELQDFLRAGGDDGAPSLDRPPVSPYGTEPGPAKRPWSAEKFQFTADSLRDVAEASWPAMLDHVGDEASQLHLRTLEHTVLSLEAQARRMDQECGGGGVLQGFGRFGFQKRFDMMWLLKMALASSFSRSRDGLMSCLRLARALPFQDLCWDDAALQSPGLSHGVLGHMRFVLDCAFMCLQRQRNQSLYGTAALGAGMPGTAAGARVTVEEVGASRPACDVSVHLMVDSSPQAGVNWLMITQTVISGVTEAAVLAWQLQQLMRFEQLEGSEHNRTTLSQALEETITARISQHTSPPVGLASGRADVFHELHALYHALFLETGSPDLLAHKLAAVTSVTTDLGTESHFTQVPPAPLSAWFPYLGTCATEGMCGIQVGDGPGVSPLQLAQVGDGPIASPHKPSQCDGMEARDGFDVSLPGPAQCGAGMQVGKHEPDGGITSLMGTQPLPSPMAPHDCMITLQHGLPVAGGLHIISNATKSMLGAMPHFPDQIEGMLNGLVGFLHAAWSRKRFIVTCLTSDDAVPYKPLFSSFKPSLVRWRWGSLAEVVEALEPLEAPLRRFWNLDRLHFRAGASQAQPVLEHTAIDHVDEDPDEPDPFKAATRIGAAAAAVQSPLFWCWLRMLRSLMEIVAHLEHWFESCACHGGQHPGNLGMRKEAEGRKCPMRGCRAPELAAGVYVSFLRDLTGIRAVDAALRWSLECNEDQRGKILEDFEGARQHLLFILQLELAHWQSLPHVLCALGHWDETMARSTAARALKQWTQMSPTERESAHTLSQQVFTTEPLRGEFLAFVAGKERGTLPCLLSLASRLLFIPCSERRVEGTHAVTKRVTLAARHAGPVYISYSQRLPLIMELVRAGPVFSEALAKACSEVYHPLDAAIMLGLQGHPDLHLPMAELRAHGKRGSTFQHKKTVVQIVYHMDSHAQLADLVALADAGKASQNQGPKGFSGSSQLTLLDRLMQTHALDLLRKGHEPGNYYVLMTDRQEANSIHTISLTAAKHPGALDAPSAVLDALAAPNNPLPGAPLPRPDAAMPLIGFHLPGPEATVPLPGASLPGPDSAQPLPGVDFPVPEAELMELAFEPDSADCMASSLPLCNPKLHSFSAMDPSDPLVFKVLSLRPSIVKTPMGDEPSDLRWHDVAVTLHPVVEVDWQTQTLAVSVRPVVFDDGSEAMVQNAYGIHVHQTAAIIRDAPVHKLMVFKTQPGGWHCDLPLVGARPLAGASLPGHQFLEGTDISTVQQMVRRLAEAGAFHGSLRTFSKVNLQKEELTALSYLAGSGMVCEQAGGHCQLSSLGTSSIMVCHKLVDGHPLVTTEEDRPIQERSTSALLLLLANKGWQVEAWPSSGHGWPPPLQLVATGVPHDKRLCYVRPDRSRIGRFYALALVKVMDQSFREALCAAGLKQMDHLQKEKYYQTVAEGKNPTQRRGWQSTGAFVPGDEEPLAFVADGDLIWEPARLPKRRKKGPDDMPELVFVPDLEGHAQQGPGLLVPEPVQGPEPQQPQQDIQAGRYEPQGRKAQRLRRPARQKVQRGFKLNTGESFHWGCVSFYYKKGPKDGYASYQCICPRRSHTIDHGKRRSSSRTACSKTVRFHSEEEKELVRRKLKTWVLAGFAKDCQTREDHQAMWTKFMHHTDDDLWDESILDSKVEPKERPLTDDEHCPPAAPRQARQSSSFDSSSSDSDDSNGSSGSSSSNSSDSSDSDSSS
jgi:hypothetical protein